MTSNQECSAARASLRFRNGPRTGPPTGDMSAHQRPCWPGSTAICALVTGYLTGGPRLIRRLPAVKMFRSRHLRWRQIALLLHAHHYPVTPHRNPCHENHLRPARIVVSPLCGGTFAADAPAAKSADQTKTKAAARKDAPGKRRFAASDAGRRALRARSETGARISGRPNRRRRRPCCSSFMAAAGGGNRASVVDAAAGNAQGRASPSSPSSIGSSRRHTPRA